MPASKPLRRSKRRTVPTRKALEAAPRRPVGVCKKPQVRAKTQASTDKDCNVAPGCRDNKVAYLKSWLEVDGSSSCGSENNNSSDTTSRTSNSGSTNTNSSSNTSNTNNSSVISNEAESGSEYVESSLDEQDTEEEEVIRDEKAVGIEVASTVPNTEESLNGKHDDVNDCDSSDTGSGLFVSPRSVSLPSDPAATCGCTKPCTHRPGSQFTIVSADASQVVDKINEVIASYLLRRNYDKISIRLHISGDALADGDVADGLWFVERLGIGQMIETCEDGIVWMLDPRSGSCS